MSTVLKNNNPFIPKVARYFAGVGSTNDEMTRALAAGAKLSNGAVFLSRSQTAGRGQGGNRWHASPGDNLTLSLLARPDDLSVHRIFDLNRWVSLAVAATVRGYAAPARVTVKWPNDVYVGDRKIAGILIQNGLVGQRVDWSVIGIGLNVNENDFPPELKRTATSMRLLTGQTHELEDVFEQLSSHLSANWSNLRALPQYCGTQLHASYEAQLYLRHTDHVFTDLETQRPFAGRLLGTTPDGRLEIATATGHHRYFRQRTLAYSRDSS